MAYPANPADFQRQQLTPENPFRKSQMGYGAAAGAQTPRPMDTALAGSGGGGGGGGYSFGYNELDPIGYDTYTKTADSQHMAQDHSYDLEKMKVAQDFARESLASLQQNLGTSGGSVTATFNQPGGGFQPPAQLQAPDNSAANDAIFAREKDKVGQMATGALAGLRSQLGGRNLLGSGMEARGMQNTAIAGLGQLGEVSREQAIQDAGQSADFAKLGYQGAITQRGQDIGATQAANELMAQLAQAEYQGQIAQRGQNMNLQQAILGGLLRY